MSFILSLSLFVPKVYKVILEIVFKLAPTLLIASLNVRIMIVYRQTCNKRRRMTLSHTKDDDSRKFAEERRLMFLLGTSPFPFFSLIVSSPSPSFASKSVRRRRDKMSADKPHDMTHYALFTGSSSLLFLVCVSPMAILHVTLSSENLSSYSYQVSCSENKTFLVSIKALNILVELGRKYVYERQLHKRDQEFLSRGQ
jgi:neurotensin receptor 1